jgi:hypothetical protein
MNLYFISISMNSAVTLLRHFTQHTAVVYFENCQSLVRFFVYKMSILYSLLSGKFIDFQFMFYCSRISLSPCYIFARFIVFVSSLLPSTRMYFFQELLLLLLSLACIFQFSFIFLLFLNLMPVDRTNYFSLLFPLLLDGDVQLNPGAVSKTLSALKICSMANSIKPTSLQLWVLYL